MGKRYKSNDGWNSQKSTSMEKPNLEYCPDCNSMHEPDDCTFDLEYEENPDKDYNDPEDDHKPDYVKRND